MKALTKKIIIIITIKVSEILKLEKLLFYKNQKHYIKKIMSFFLIWITDLSQRE